VPLIKIKRAYQAPTRSDGFRVLVDRVWPRGVKKEDLAVGSWAKDVAPSTDLRKWFAHDPSRWEEFADRYRRELGSPPSQRALRELAQRAVAGQLTLVYGARDQEHNNAVVLKRELERRVKARPRA
jgi:uncharacterized protein YeaO (DUF488 family)